MIKPTVGRVVWYRPGRIDHEQMTIFLGQPLAAIVAFVWSDTLVNLTVSDHNGATHSRTSVYLDQGEGRGQSAPYCEWMPYQKGQATMAERAAAMASASEAHVARAEAAADAAGLDVSALGGSSGPRCRECADSDGWCSNRHGANCGFPKGHALHREAPFRPAGDLLPLGVDRLPAGTPLAEGFTETGAAGPIGSDPGRLVPRHGSGCVTSR